MKRGYFTYNETDEDAGLAVVATSAREARMIAYKSGEFIYGDTNWIDVRAIWVRNADVSGLPIGVAQDSRDALLRGLYGSVYEYPCDECGKDADVQAHDGRVLCPACIEKEYQKELRE